MNNILELKGRRFIQAPKTVQGGGASMNSRFSVTSLKLEELMSQLTLIQKFWEDEKRIFSGVLVSVYYNKIVAKSNRISGIFKGNKSNFSVVGAKFNQDKSAHIITYYLDSKDLSDSLTFLKNTKDIIDSYFQNGVNKSIFEDSKNFEKIPFDRFNLSKSKFLQIIADVSYIELFDVEQDKATLRQNIVSLYNTGVDTLELLNSLGIDVFRGRLLDKYTVFLEAEQLEILSTKAPYLIAMATENWLDLSPEDFAVSKSKELMFVPKPTIEPIIGVIDTLFDENVYFNEWVEYHCMLPESIPIDSEDYKHGTAVSSIIVDGPALNPWLDDGCGRFRVRHFGVAKASKFSSFLIIKSIKEIVANNRDIKVWNISLGSNQEISDNFISAEAAILDQIQFENDVIFVIAGTNLQDKNSAEIGVSEIKKIGSPADSINSIVVNSVNIHNEPTSYARRGLALSFFAKPDVSYYGGSKERYIRVCEPLGEAMVAGTSFAAPWIARKLSYLIDVLGINRIIAKAILIDSARGWNEAPSIEDLALLGHGIVPINIKDILYTKSDEIRFLVSDISEQWNTYNYDFPIPLKDDKYPYIARATMCYFPMCDRTQGVDYTNTELNLHFGRIKNDGKIADIKGDPQNKENKNDEEKIYLLEGEARAHFRKWDNVKYIVEKQKNRHQPKKSYQRKEWGMEIKTNNRLDPYDGIGIRFGVVVTLKEINGINRIDEFIRNCALKGWIVNKIDIHSRIDIHNKVNEEIEFS